MTHNRQGRQQLTERCHHHLPSTGGGGGALILWYSPQPGTTFQVLRRESLHTIAPADPQGPLRPALSLPERKHLPRCYYLSTCPGYMSPHHLSPKWKNQSTWTAQGQQSRAKGWPAKSLVKVSIWVSLPNYHPVLQPKRGFRRAGRRHNSKHRPNTDGSSLQNLKPVAPWNQQTQKPLVPCNTWASARGLFERPSNSYYLLLQNTPVPLSKHLAAEGLVQELR